MTVIRSPNGLSLTAFGRGGTYVRPISCTQKPKTWSSLRAEAKEITDFCGNFLQVQRQEAEKADGEREANSLES